MTHIFSAEPSGIQEAPHDPRILATGHQIALREVSLGAVKNKEDLMLAFSEGLSLSRSFGNNWDALYDVLTDEECFSERFAILFHDLPHFKKHYSKLYAELESVLLDAQANAAENGRSLWLLK